VALFVLTYVYRPDLVAEKAQTSVNVRGNAAT